MRELRKPRDIEQRRIWRPTELVAFRCELRSSKFDGVLFHDICERESINHAIRSRDQRIEPAKACITSGSSRGETSTPSAFLALIFVAMVMTTTTCRSWSSMNENWEGNVRRFFCPRKPREFWIENRTCNGTLRIRASLWVSSAKSIFRFRTRCISRENCSVNAEYISQFLQHSERTYYALYSSWLWPEYHCSWLDEQQMLHMPLWEQRQRQWYVLVLSEVVASMW